MDLPPLAFVDVETTGVNPRENRITEIGVITVDGDRASEWTTVINPLTRRQERPHLPDGITDEMRGAAPRFKDIAADLARRLAGRLFIAHNARFDYEFLKAEFGRTGIEFHPEVLCSLMLSRRLYSQSGHHDLDSLIERHGLEAEVRHRALHDAKLIWQFWQTIHREHPAAALVTTIEALRAGPVLPAYLHPALIDRLPEAPGVYVFHGEDDEILRAGTASNLKARVLQYFRLDLVSAPSVGHLASDQKYHLARHKRDARRAAPIGAAVRNSVARAETEVPNTLFVAVRPRRLSLSFARIALRTGVRDHRRIVRHLRFTPQGAQCTAPNCGRT